MAAPFSGITATLINPRHPHTLRTNNNNYNITEPSCNNGVSLIVVFETINIQLWYLKRLQFVDIKSTKYSRYCRRNRRNFIKPKSDENYVCFNATISMFYFSHLTSPGET